MMLVYFSLQLLRFAALLLATKLEPFFNFLKQFLIKLGYILA